MTRWRRLEAALAALLATFVIGTVGYRLLGFGWLDALYQTVTTVATVGFREVQPLSRAGQVFTMALILVGVGTALYTFGAFVEAILEGQLRDVWGRRRMERRIDALRDHVIVCGWGRVGRAYVEYATGAGQHVVVVDRDEERLADVAHPNVHGDATSDDTLRRAGIERAHALVAVLDSDADNLFVTLSGRQLNPGVFIVARVRTLDAESKFLQAGANRVVNPQAIGGARIAAFVRQPHVAEFLDAVMHDGSLEFRLEEITVPARSALAGRTLRDAHIRDRTGALVLALRDGDGTFTTNPTPESVLADGQVLIAIGTAVQLKALEELASGP